MRKHLKLISIMLCTSMLFLLGACSTPNSTDELSTVAPSPSANDTQQSGGASSGKTLVVFYSATGSTKAVAEAISDALNADVFEIIPQDPYSSADLDWTDENSRVSQEHNDPSLRAVPLASATVDEWDSYSTVFIGYPV